MRNDWSSVYGPNKPKTWIVRRYFGRFSEARSDRWIFGNRADTAKRGDVPHLVKFSWTDIAAPARRRSSQPFTPTAQPDTHASQGEQLPPCSHVRTMRSFSEVEASVTALL